MMINFRYSERDTLREMYLPRLKDCARVNLLVRSNRNT